MNNWPSGVSPISRWCRCSGGREPRPRALRRGTATWRRVGAEKRRQEFQCDLTSEALVARPVDHRHTAVAERGLHEVLRNATSGPLGRRLANPRRAGFRTRVSWSTTPPLSVRAAVTRLPPSAQRRRRIERRGMPIAHPPATQSRRQGSPESTASDRRHGSRASRRAHPCSSRFNHARAVDHSRLRLPATHSSLGGLLDLMPP